MLPAPGEVSDFFFFLFRDICSLANKGTFLKITLSDFLEMHADYGSLILLPLPPKKVSGKNSLRETHC